ncbi:MAG: dienelactone hydrolase family protein [Sinobacteraceae bacterium]|nr:dienelactone hydrolase family protein [Nevskiaceae bacterium]
MSEIQIRPGLSGYYAQPTAGKARSAVVVMMEAYGLTAHIRGVCHRLAAAGHIALAPDYYHGRIVPYADSNTAISLLRELDDDALLAETAAALDFLVARHPETTARLAVCGFCMGGRLAFLAACRHAHRLAAAVSFYGGAIGAEGERDRLGRRPPLPEAAALRAPLLLIYGAEDPSIAPAEHARVAQRLSELKKRYVLSLYPGAAHGFCCEERAAYAPDAARAAFAEMFAFLRAQGF